MQWYDILIRLTLAIVIGLIIGFERERHHRPAGMKTHIMVCMGAAIVSLIQVGMVEQTVSMVTANSDLAAVIKTDLGRMGAQVISGIGFLGAGTILVKNGSVKGLTTASTLWLTACVGLAVGMGYYAIAVGGFVMVMAVLILLRILQKKRFYRSSFMLEVKLANREKGVDEVNAFCRTRGIVISGVEVSEEDANQITYIMQIPLNYDPELLVSELTRERNILKAAQATE